MNTENPIISFVSPIYKAEKIISELVDEIRKVTDILNQSYEIILVDDRSPDDSWNTIVSISKKFPEIKSIRLSRNFGQHAAIIAGLSICQGEWIVVLDCDLQDQPKEVLKLYNKAKEGYDIVLAKRKIRQDNFFKKTSSFLFAKIYGFFTDTSFDYQVANFGIYNRKVIKSILSISDYNKAFPLFVGFVGFNSIAIEVEHAQRKEGKSSYTFSKRLSLAFNSIISFSNKPLKLFVKSGLLISLISFLMGIYHFYLAITDQIQVLGYSSIIISIWFLSGVIITTIGITGIYIGKIFDQTKNRPVFIIDETTFDHSKE